MRNASPGEGGFLLGTDSHGRDVLTRLLWGARVSLLIGIVPTVCAMLISLVLGLMAAYLGGWVDQIIMRALDVLFAFPLVLLAIAIAGALEPGATTEILAIMIVLVPYIARLVRTSTLQVRAQPYVEAGARRRRQDRHHHLPLHPAQHDLAGDRLHDHADRAS